MEITRKYENTMKDVDYYRKQERAAYTALQNLRMQYEEVGLALFILFKNSGGSLDQAWQSCSECQYDRHRQENLDEFIDRGGSTSFCFLVSCIALPCHSLCLSVCRVSLYTPGQQTHSSLFLMFLQVVAEKQKLEREVTSLQTIMEDDRKEIADLRRQQQVSNLLVRAFSIVDGASQN